jgi:3',5'-cyclic AMP phosphodiesterase CpdA
VTGDETAAPSLWAISDLHVGYTENRDHVEALRPVHADDWLIVAGDVAERVTDIEWTLATVTRRFARVFWTPGNHELWTHPSDPSPLRGEERYRRLVQICRDLGVRTPEDPFEVWTGPGGPASVVPLFVLYDYSFRPPGTSTTEEGLRYAYRSGIVCADERYLHPDPYPSREAWCAARLAYSRERLDALDPAVPTVLVNHFPLVREPTRVLRYPEFAQWCGTEETADWHTRYAAAVAVYGHLHIPRETVHDGVPFVEVSVGYPREWRRYLGSPPGLRRVLPR